MKRVMWLLILAASSLSTPLKAQENLDNLPANTIVKPFKLEIGFYKTTVLIFSSPVLLGDRGFNEIITAKEKGLANILKIKAARKNFSPTNLHVFTSDGKVYPFEIIFSEHPSAFTFDLEKLGQKDSVSARDRVIKFTGNKISEAEFKNELNRVKSAKSFFGASVHKYDMSLRLKNILVSGERMFFSFEIANKSNMAYDLDFMRTYIRDKEKGKRSSFEEKEIIPFYKDCLVTLSGRAKSEFIIGLPKFTLSDNKDFCIELFEKNGERHLSMKIKSRQLLHSKNLLTQDGK